MNILSKLFRKRKSPTEIIQPTDITKEIYNAFYTESNMIREKVVSKEEQDLINKRQRLIDLGFTNSQEVMRGATDRREREWIKRQNEIKKTLPKAIEHFEKTYPNHKFITEESVRVLCEKYNLAYKAAEKYKRSVTLECLNEIEGIKDSLDDCYVYITSVYGSYIIEYMNISELDHAGFSDTSNDHVFVARKGKCAFEIVAPLKDFNTDSYEEEQLIKKLNALKVFKIDMTIPIVLKPVVYEKQKHYLIANASVIKNQIK